MARCFPDCFVNLQQRAATTCSAVDEYDAPAVDIQCGTKLFDFHPGWRNELGPDGHCHPFDSPGRYAAGGERLQRFIGGDKVSIDVGRTPSSPEWGKRIRQERIAGDAHLFLLDEALEEVIHHRMNRQDNIGSLLIDKSADISPDFKIKKVALIRPN